MLQFIVNPDLKQEHKEKLKSFMNNHKEINELKIGNLNQIKIILNGIDSEVVQGLYLN